MSLEARLKKRGRRISWDSLQRGCVAGRDRLMTPALTRRHDPRQSLCVRTGDPDDIPSETLPPPRHKEGVGSVVAYQLNPARAYR